MKRGEPIIATYLEDREAITELQRDFALRFQAEMVFHELPEAEQQTRLQAELERMSHEPYWELITQEQRETLAACAAVAQIQKEMSR